MANWWNVFSIAEAVRFHFSTADAVPLQLDSVVNLTSMIFRRNTFGHYLLLRRLLMSAIGMWTFPMYKVFNRTNVTGLEVLDDLPTDNVLFVANHETYFSDVILMYHAFAARRIGQSRIGIPWYLFTPRLNTFYIAAEETMKDGLLPKVFAYTGAVTTKRTWRHAGKNVDRPVAFNDITRIRQALDAGWVITFPQGTTTPFQPARRGTAHIIKQARPVVVPVTVQGLRKAFDKKGLKMKKRGVELKLHFKAPLEIDYDAAPEFILREIMDAIEQSERYRKIRSKKDD